ncbi:MAG: YgiT-type zinc finger protein [Gammaproteobacteria bacterium]|nr:MAG: YgiT-type zinc finger protein [Gammaproteobacteria bacterium]
MNETKLNILCECCGEMAVTETTKRMPIEYGDGDDAIVLYAQVPVFVCKSCEFEYTDSRAEDIRHDTICKHLNLLTSVELKSMRNDLGWSVAKLAAETALGQASLTRWENCQCFQTKANDKLLRFTFEKHGVFIKDKASKGSYQFRTIVINPFMEARAAAFSL